MHIRHLVLDCSSLWVVGRSVTSRDSTLLLHCQCLKLPATVSSNMRVTLCESNWHLYLPFALFHSMTQLDMLASRRESCLFMLSQTPNLAQLTC